VNIDNAKLKTHRLKYQGFFKETKKRFTPKTMKKTAALKRNGLRWSNAAFFVV